MPSAPFVSAPLCSADSEQREPSDALQANTTSAHQQNHQRNQRNQLNQRHHHHQRRSASKLAAPPRHPSEQRPAAGGMSADACRPRRRLQLALALLVLAVQAAHLLRAAEARVTFEKMTNRDYSGANYYTIQNVSLFECLGWCKEESSCTSAVFSFVVNPFAALQETTCMLQNETQARQGAYLRTGASGEQLTVVAQAQKATNLYFFNKIELQTEAVCSRLWAFERFPNRRLRTRDRGQAFHSSSKEACQAACMNEQRFVCRSLEYNYVSQQCALSAQDRRSPLTIQLASQAAPPGAHHHDLLDAPGTDYFENACLLGEDICNESRIYDYAKVGLPLQRVAHFVELNYYPDKEMLVKSQAGCVRACTIEHEFICRSILYRSTFKQGQPNCALYHLDQRTFPEGAEAFASHAMQPLLDSGETSAVYLEAVCNDTIAPPLTQSGGGGGGGGGGSTITMPPTSLTILPSATTPGAISVYPAHQNHTPAAIAAELERLAAATSTLSPVSGNGNAGPPTTIRLPGSSFRPDQPPGNLIIGESRQPAPSMPAHITISPPPSGSGPQTIHVQASGQIGAGNAGGASRPQMPQHITISPAAPTRDTGLIIEPTSLLGSSMQPAGGSHEQNCDAHGFCYDVALKCTDTKMVVNVKTQRPFFGRIYALGRSETCNANIKNQNQFQLDMYLTGQECNTQSMSGTYTNTIVLQHHNVVLTKADKVYHVRCTYETASRNVSFGMMPVKDMFEVDNQDRHQETISITASSDAPLPKISILTLDGKEASTVRIGDRLTFRIEIPDNTPYGIFARSCIAMAKDARSTFEIVDEHGCPVDHTIFPNFLPAPAGNALESNYEAFRFTESYGVIFQCNVKYCIGKCEPVNCGIGRDSVEAWGRRKRSIGEPRARGPPGKQLADDMTLSREIVVLDLKEKAPGAPAEVADAAELSSSGAGRPASGADDDDGAAEPAEPADRPAPSHADAGAGAPGNNNQLHCLTSQSLLLAAGGAGAFFVAYVGLVAYLFARRDAKISVIKQQYH